MPRTPSTRAAGRFLPALAVTAAILATAWPVRDARAEAPAGRTATPATATPAPSIAADTLRPDKPAAKPYLSDALAPDTVQILSPPPGGQSPRENSDRAVFNTTRALRGSPRWELASADVAEGAAAILETFSCVLGTRIDQARVPAVINLLERARLDVVRATKAPKVHYRRLRPFVGNDAPICVQRTQALADSFSYPSGHATQGWTYALIVAALVPEKATAILSRGRAYGESRVVCGVHWLSDVAAGRVNGSVVFAALVGDAAFRADLDRARAEMARAMAAAASAPADPAICAREAAALREQTLEF